jgi:hypothetical protein
LEYSYSLLLLVLELERFEFELNLDLELDAQLFVGVTPSRKLQECHYNADCLK